MRNETIQPELSDIMEMIHRYCAANKNNVCFIGSFWAADEKKINEEKEDITKDGSDRVFAYGYKESLLVMLNELKQCVKKYSNKKGFVNI